MNTAKLQVKLFAAAQPGGLAPLVPALVPILHDLIKNRVLPELMIDVASYEHVPNGPGVLFVGHGSDYFVDEGKGRVGLLYSRKRDAPPAEQRLSDALRRTLRMAALLETDPRLGGKLRFDTGEILLRVNDRLGAPNTEHSLAAWQPELVPFFATLFAGAAFSLVRGGEPRELLSITVRLHEAAGAPDAAALLARLGGPPAA